MIHALVERGNADAQIVPRGFKQLLVAHQLALQALAVLIEHQRVPRVAPLGAQRDKELLTQVIPCAACVSACPSAMVGRENARLGRE